MSERITASQLMDTLMSDPEFVRREQEREAQRMKAAGILAEAEAGLVRELRGAGMSVDSVWDLVGWKGDNDAALRVLLAHAPILYPERVREGILRALATPGARTWWPHLVEMYESDTLALPPQIDYLTAGVLSAAADDTVIDDVIRLASDPNAGFKRVLLLFALKKSRNPRAKMLLNELRSDPVIGKEVKRMRRLERLQGVMACGMCSRLIFVGGPTQRKESGLVRLDEQKLIPVRGAIIVCWRSGHGDSDGR